MRLIPARTRRVYVLKCRTPDGWVELAELDEKISSVEAKERFEEDIESNDCLKIKLEEYAKTPDGERKWVKKHWERQLKRRKAISASDILGATAFQLIEAVEACEKLRSILGSVASGSDFLELVRTIIMLRNPQAAGALAGVKRGVSVEASEEALREAERAIEEFAEAEPCPKCLEKTAGEAGGGAEAGEGKG